MRDTMRWRKKRLIVIGLLLLGVALAAIGVRTWIKVLQRRSQTDKFAFCLRQMLLNEPEGFHEHRLPESTTLDNNGRQLYSWRYRRYVFHFPTGKPLVLNHQWNAPALESIRRLDVSEYCYSGTSETCVMAIVGKDTAFNRRHELQIRDIPADCILLVEVRKSGVHWMQPGDFDVATMPRTINAPSGKGISSILGDGFHIGFADGKVWYLSNDTPFSELEKFFTIGAAKRHNRNDILGKYKLYCE